MIALFHLQMAMVMPLVLLLIHRTLATQSKQAQKARGNALVGDPRMTRGRYFNDIHTQEGGEGAPK